MSWERGVLEAAKQELVRKKDESTVLFLHLCVRGERKDSTYTIHERFGWSFLDITDVRSAHCVLWK